MQELTIRFDSEQDLQFLLMILDKMHFVYEPPVLNEKKAAQKPVKPIPEKQDAAAAPAKNIADKYIGKMPDETASKIGLPQNFTGDPAKPILKPSDRLAGKLSSETAKALLAHIEESRNEWERNF